MVARRIRPLRHLYGRRRREDVTSSSSPAIRLLEHLRPHTREAARRKPTLDLLARDEEIHARTQREGGGHCARLGEEQGERPRPPVRATRREDHRRGCNEERADLLPREEARRVTPFRWSRGGDPRLGGCCEE